MRIRPLLILMALALLATTCRTTREEGFHIKAGGFRVATYNVNYGLAGDPQGLAAAEETAAHIIAYQEVTPRWAKSLKALAKKMGHRCIFDPQDHAGGLGLCSAYDIVEHEIIPNDFSWFFATLSLVKTPRGPLQVLNVHLRPPFADDGSIVKGIVTTGSVREREMQEFVQWLDPELPAIVLGDFNEASGGAIDTLKGRDFTSVLVAANVDDPTWHWTFSGVEVTYTLDHIFVGPRVEVVDGYVIAAGRSDHYPVVGDVALR